MATTNSINNSTKTTIFLVDGSFVKDSRTKTIDLYMVDSGDGGGSGFRQPADSGGGGGGGASGGNAFYSFPASILGASTAVKIGIGGIGGVAQTLDDSDSVIPTAKAQKTSFGEFGFLDSTLPDIFGVGGLSGDPFAEGSVCLNQKLTRGADGAVGDIGYSVGAPGGSSGGGNSSTASKEGGTTPPILGNSGAILVAGAAGGTEAGTINGSNGSDGYPWTTLMNYGTGGAGGGGQKAGAVAGTGGDGGFPGGGGGGGGASINGTNSGAGGNGGNGIVVVVEYF